ncbi:MAG: hypothetical protein COB46_12315 [Rhodospirillaceae bacterium]|nr:MAG: hypothetical protein COB46_12315 [Rhodospirillaceae bacterium]
MPLMSAVYKVQTFDATYYDGRTAVRHDVTVQLYAEALDILGADGQVIEQWPYQAISLSDQGGGTTRLVVEDSEARLVLSSSEAFQALKNRAPNIDSQKQRTLRNMGLSVLVTVGLIGVAYVSIPVMASAVVAMIPYETEKNIGEGYAKDMQALFSKTKAPNQCTEDAGVQALNTMVTYLSAYSSGPFGYQVDVLDNTMVNAMALPGGHMFIFRGLIDKAESSDELAGVLAHEMAHVNHRHGMHGVVRSFGFQMLSDMMFGGNVMGNLSNIMMMMSHSREAERQADIDAIETLRRANISTAGIARFFERLKDKEDEGKGSFFKMPNMLSSHPSSDVREALAREVQSTSSTGWALSEAQWKNLKAICGK